MIPFYVCIERNGQFKQWDIFDHSNFYNSLVKLGYERKLTKENILRELRYYFSFKCEYEFVLTSWPTGKAEKKVSVHDQVLLNWDIFYKIVKENFDKSN